MGIFFWQVKTMNKLIPKSKLSKKARQARQKRVSWAFSPVTRKKEGQKRYRRAGAAEQRKWADPKGDA